MHSPIDSTPSPAAVYVGNGQGLEKTQLTYGIIPLTDCAPLVIAKEKGFFARYGLDVELSSEASWANIRDKVLVGALDGAQMLAPMPLATTLGIGGMQEAMVTAFSMDLNGNGITVSNDLYQRMLAADPAAMQEQPLSANALKTVIQAEQAEGRTPLTFASVFPFSAHHYALRYWLASANIDPDRDVNLVVIPPPQMTGQLRSGVISGYCVGEPWNAQAVSMNVGRTLITNYELWNNMPEKVFGVTERWAAQNPNTHLATLMALLEAAKWLDQTENRMEAVRILTQGYIAAPESVLQMSMLGTFQYASDEKPCKLPDFNVFYRYAATFPWRSHALWFLTQMRRWHQISNNNVDLKAVAEAVYRPDIYRQAADALGVPYPTIDYKVEGVHEQAWLLNSATQPIVMGPDQFFDKRLFDPMDLESYYRQF